MYRYHTSTVPFYILYTEDSELDKYIKVTAIKNISLLFKQRATLFFIHLLSKM